MLINASHLEYMYYLFVINKCTNSVLHMDFGSQLYALIKLLNICRIKQVQEYNVFKNTQ